MVAEDLAQALKSNRIFRHKIAAHDLLSYALHNSTEVFFTITNEQLQRGDEMAQDGLLPDAAADAIASAFFDFVVKHNLADTMTTMASEEIQVIAVFSNHLF